MRAGGLLLTVALVASGCGATVRTSTPDVNPSVAPLLDFQARVDDYMELRSEAADEVPDAEVTADPAAIRARELLLAAHIRARRLRAKHGDIFTPEIRRHFRRLLAPELKGEQLDDINAVLQEDAPAPGAVPIEVNAKYPAGVPFPTTPSAILLVLPPLPPGVLEYRIVGKDLILLDQPADVIVDYIRNIIP